SDYDMLLTQELAAGVDVWVNNPRRPWEACGTSGMKVLVNGGLNLSELDGWWAEAYAPDVGWALGDGQEHGDDPAWDAAEAEALYDRLEKEVIPEFYDRDASGIPVKWVARVRNSMARLTPRFSANRTVREYTEDYYLPAAAAYRSRSARSGARGAEIANRRKILDREWPNVRIGQVQVTEDGTMRVFEASIHLAALDPDWVVVEVYADGAGDEGPVREPMERGRALEAENGYAYGARLPASRPASDFTVRVVARMAGVKAPLEVPHILWQR
ncbi:MAG TPA: alpha-glucan family phosphorylase, partial [Candidatus Bathyarchaeia archaeon]|nr:alpha-glucan family phosphorylase [Candidatus Bathyarchaeia archaeon]